MKNILLTAITMLTFVFGYSHETIFTGSITDEFNNPVEHAYVLILNADDSSLVQGIVTDESGRFSFEGLEDGKYIVSVDHVSFESPLNFNDLVNINGATEDAYINSIDVGLEVVTGNIQISEDLNTMHSHISPRDLE